VDTHPVPPTARHALLLPTPVELSECCHRGGQNQAWTRDISQPDQQQLSGGFVATPLWRHNVCSAQARSRGEHMILPNGLINPGSLRVAPSCRFCDYDVL
jgi:hypothetical protein